MLEDARKAMLEDAVRNCQYERCSRSAGKSMLDDAVRVDHAPRLSARGPRGWLSLLRLNRSSSEPIDERAVSPDSEREN